LLTNKPKACGTLKRKTVPFSEAKPRKRRTVFDEGFVKQQSDFNEVYFDGLSIPEKE
jgi:hypothetical protein